jgi:DNA-directed RNA polymerase subunit RPC12/RpoP
MPTEYDNDLLREGILRYRYGEYDAARGFVQRALDTADDLDTRAQANYFLSLLTDDPVQKRNYLEETLSIDMTHAEARRALAVIDGRLEPGALFDPEVVSAPKKGQQLVFTDRFTCPKCGGRMVFTPDGASLVCESCQTRKPLSTQVRSTEQDFFVAMANGSGQRAPVATQVFRCQGCGADFILAPGEISADCSYCGSPHVVALQTKKDLVEPDSILPVAFDRQRAYRYMLDWMKAGKFAVHSQQEQPRGLYLTVWLFDILGALPWKGIRYRKDGQEIVSGEKEIHLDDVCVLGSKKLAGLMQGVLPEFDFSNAAAYDSRFLSGWMAQVNDVSMADASLEARRIAVERVRLKITGEFGYIHDLTYSTARLMVNAFKLVLVPVWLGKFQKEGHSLRLLINGRNGSVVSEFKSGGVKSWIENAHGN